MATTGGNTGEGTTIYTARRVVTMDDSQPVAEAVAVRDGRFLGAGRVDELVGWGDHTVDTRFADHVLLPGFVEAHTHVMAGGMWQFPDVGYFDRTDPFGTTWAGCPDIDGVIERLVGVETGHVRSRCTPDRLGPRPDLLRR